MILPCYSAFVCLKCFMGKRRGKHNPNNSGSSEKCENSPKRTRENNTHSFDITPYNHLCSTQIERMEDPELSHVISKDNEFGIPKNQKSHYIKRYGRDWSFP